LSDKLYSARVDECFFFSPAKLRITSDDFVKYLAFSARREKKGILIKFDVDDFLYIAAKSMIKAIRKGSSHAI
jgi:hypothetical protein